MIVANSYTQKNSDPDSVKFFKKKFIEKSNSKKSKIVKEANGDGGGLLSDDIVEDLRTCNMNLSNVCDAMKNSVTEQSLMELFEISPAEAKIILNAISQLKKEITIQDISSTPSLDIRKVDGSSYIVVSDITGGIKLMFSDNNQLLKKLVTLQGFLNYATQPGIPGMNLAQVTL